MAEQPLEDKLFDKSKHAELARAVEQLSPEEAQFFLTKLEKALKRKRIQMIGYMAAMLTWAVGMLVAFGFFAAGTGFMVWVFLVPFALAGLILYIFGLISSRG